MKYYVPDRKVNILHIYDEKGKILNSKDMDRWEEWGIEEKVGLVCFHIAQGKSVQKTAIGVKGFPTVDEFFRAVESIDECEEMYYDARKRRQNYLIEKLVDLDNKDEINTLGSVIKVTNISIKESLVIDDEEGKKRTIPTFNTFLSKEKLHETQTKGTGGVFK